jgi:phage tail protein X
VNALGLDADAVRAFITGKRPTYPQFEAWIRVQPGANLTKANIHKLNVAISGYIHTDAVRQSVLAANGLPDDGSVLPDAININNLDDWFEFHQAVLK